MIEAFVLLIVFQFKHLIADYYLQFPYMYLNKGQKTGWFYPLLHHSMVHAFFTMVILFVYFIFIDVGMPLIIFYLGVFDLITHFITDRWKATRGKTPDQPKFWTNLGIDQMIHHVVGIIIVFVAVN